MGKPNLNYLQGKVVAILGYAEKGRPHAELLRDAGIEVVVALREGFDDSEWKESGFEVLSVSEAVDRANVIQVW